jgi:DNA invertase Pin-like site-specific DNA recombinase
MSEYVIAKYIRLSQDDTVSESLSIPHQRLLLDCHIEDMNMPGAQVLEFVDNGFTGTNVERPGFQEMIEFVRCGRINCIVVKDFSRFARNALESGYYIEKVFPLYRVRFIAVSDRFNSSDYKNGIGGIDVAFKFMMNEYYSADLSKKIKSAKHVLMQNGEHIVGGAIYGYRKNDKGRWEHDSLSAEVVREIYDMALGGKTTAQIRDKLFADRRLAPKEYDYQKKGKDIMPEFNWTTRQIYRILTNEQYTGTYVAGKRETSRVGSKVMIEKPRSEWIIIPDSHPPIVSREEFERVQEILANPKAFVSEKPAPSNHANKLRERIVSGERKSCAVPYGYTVNNGVWEINFKIAEVVRMVFNMTLNGSSLRDICGKLRDLGIPTLNEEWKLIKGANIILTCHWKTQAVKDILKDESVAWRVSGGCSAFGRGESRAHGRKT